MNTPKATNVKIFFLKNNQKDKIFNRFYDSQILPHPNYIVDDKKKLMYLSTSLQNQKRNLSGIKKLDPNEFLIPRFYNKEKVKKQQQKIIQYENDQQNQISSLQIESNKKKQTNKRITYNSNNKFNKINSNKINPVSISKIKFNKQNGLQNKYYSICIEDKQKQPKNLAAIVKQNWNKKKILKNLRKTERTFKEFLLTDNNDMQNQQTKKVVLKTQENQKLKQNNIMLKKRFFDYTEEKFLESQRRIKYQRSKSTNNSYNHNNNNNNDKKIVFIPNKYKMNTQTNQNFTYNKKRNRSSKFNIKYWNKFKILQQKINSQSQSWWSKPQMVKKVGGEFNFKKTIAY